MQHDQDHGDGQVEMSPSTPSPSSSNSHIDLKDFPSHMDYSAGLDNDRHAFSGENNAEIAQPPSGFGKSLLYSNAGRSRISNLMFPKMRRRPFQCKYCTFSCPSATNLSIHMRIHTGEKPYKCGTCAYASARKQNLFRHMATVHKADHVTMSGPTPATCAYPTGEQSSVEERMPVVENVYGNVQDVVLINGDPVKIIGRDQGSFSSSDAASSSPHLTQVFPCESTNNSNQQDGVVEVMPASNPTSATEYSTRHYADGSRFIFAGGITASGTPSATTTGLPQNSLLDQFDTHKEIHQQQAPGSALHNEGFQQVQDMTSSDETPVNKFDNPIQPAVYKEPITGALKRKQGRATSHTTLKNILDSPLMFPNKHGSNAALNQSKILSSSNHLEKTGTEIKIIQSEEDLEELLEGRQRTNIRVASSGVCKQQDFTPSPRSLNGGCSAESDTFTYARESPDDGYYPETQLKGGTKEVAIPFTNSIPSSQTSMFRHKHTSVMKSSLIMIRKANEQKVTSCQPASEDVAVAQTSKRASAGSGSGRRNLFQQAVENLSQVSARKYRSTVSFDQSIPDRNHQPAMMFDSNSDQTVTQRNPQKHPNKSFGKASLTVQVDLNKVMCCTARKWLKSHLVECDVCEINLPIEEGEKNFSSASRNSCGVAGNRCGRERDWAQGNDEGIPGRGRFPAENQDQGCLEGRRRDSGRGHQWVDPSVTPEREDWRSGTGTGETAQRQQQAMMIEIDDEICQSDRRDITTADQIRVMNRRIISPRGLGVSPDGANLACNREAIDGSKRQKQINVGQSEGSAFRQKQSISAPNRERITVAKTSVIGPSGVRTSTPQNVDHLARKINHPRESTEYIAFLNAELNRGKAAAKRHFQKQKCFCDICGKVCHSKAQLVSHRRVHIETSQLFRCAVCRYCTLHYKLLKRHIADKHASVTKKNTYTQCKICNKAIGITKVAPHMQTVHGLGTQVADGKSEKEDDGKSDKADDGSRDELSREGHTADVECTDDQTQLAEEETPKQHDAVAVETESATLDAKDDTTADEDCTQAVAMTIKQEPTQEC